MGGCFRGGDRNCMTILFNAEIQGGGQEMAVMVGRLMVKILITTIQVNLVPLVSAPNSPELSLIKFLPLTYHHSHFLAATLDFTSFSP